MTRALWLLSLGAALQAGVVQAQGSDPLEGSYCGMTPIVVPRGCPAAVDPPSFVFERRACDRVIDDYGQEAVVTPHHWPLPGGAMQIETTAAGGSCHTGPLGLPPTAPAATRIRSRTEGMVPCCLTRQRRQ